jgi:transaldolase/glucose-6-phosphate isomerase
MTKNPLLELEQHGQSIWLDFISRNLLDSGELQNLITNDNLKGITSNPSIFEKAIAQSNDYDQAINNWAQTCEDAHALYEKLAIKDIQDAADILSPVYKKTNGLDGYVSLEVSPHLALDTAKTIIEAQHLWKEVNRPNLMIKVPGTPQGMGAIKALTSAGINVNVTLLFSVDAYCDAAIAYLLGLKDRAEKNLPINNIHSVASFFISRIDSKIDGILENFIQKNPRSSQANIAQNLLGKVAIANAKLAYRAFEDIYDSDLAKNLLKKGAHPQRLLWASTSTKNKNYRDVIYIEELIGKETVNTLPPTTLEAFRDHGQVADVITNNLEHADIVMTELKSLGVDFEHCCDELLVEGLELFSAAFDKLLEAVKTKMEKKK